MFNAVDSFIFYTGSNKHLLEAVPCKTFTEHMTSYIGDEHCVATV